MPSKWRIHLYAFRKLHPSLTLKECMQQASITYRSSTHLDNIKLARTERNEFFTANIKQKEAIVKFIKSFKYDSADVKEMQKLAKRNNAQNKVYISDGTYYHICELFTSGNAQYCISIQDRVKNGRWRAVYLPYLDVENIGWFVISTGTLNWKPPADEPVFHNGS